MGKPRTSKAGIKQNPLPDAVQGKTKEDLPKTEDLPTLGSYFQHINRVEASIEKFMDSQAKSFNFVYDKFEQLTLWIGTLENRIKVLECPDALKQKPNELIKSELATLKEELSEDIEKVKRDCNLVIMNVPETMKGLQTVRNLMTTLLPNQHTIVRDNRIGPAKPNSDRPRLLRIFLSCKQKQKLALLNCVKMKDLPEFKGISVCKDLTKMEQEINKRIYLERMQQLTQEKPVSKSNSSGSTTTHQH